jgi:hypothetical protein
MASFLHAREIYLSAANSPKSHRNNFVFLFLTYSIVKEILYLYILIFTKVDRQSIPQIILPSRIQRALNHCNLSMSGAQNRAIPR